MLLKTNPKATLQELKYVYVFTQYFVAAHSQKFNALKISFKYLAIKGNSLF